MIVFGNTKNYIERHKNSQKSNLYYSMTIYTFIILISNQFNVLFITNVNA